MSRASRHICFASAIGILLLTISFSCGPRSGIHNDEQTGEANNFTAVDTTSLSFKRDIKLSEAFDKGKKLFKQNCAVCHMGRSDQRLTGPGLKGLRDRLPQPAENWFVNYTLNSDSVFKSGDRYAEQLRRDYDGVQMTTFSGQLTTEQVKLIYSYLTAPPAQRGCVIE